MQNTQSLFVLSALLSVSNASGMEVRNLRNMAAQTVLQNQLLGLNISHESTDDKQSMMRDSHPVGGGGSKRSREEESSQLNQDCDRLLAVEYSLQNFDKSWQTIAQNYQFRGAHKRNILCCGFIRNSRLGYSACAGGTFCLWDFGLLSREPEIVQEKDAPHVEQNAEEKGKKQLFATRVFQDTLHAKNIYSVCISADQQYIVTGSEDKTAKLWQLNISFDENLQQSNIGITLVATFEHPEGVTAVALNNDCTALATGAKDGNVRIFDLVNLRKNFPLVSSASAQCLPFVEKRLGRDLILVKKVTFCDEIVMACGGVAGCIKSWNWRTSETVSQEMLERFEIITSWGLRAGACIPCYGSGDIGITQSGQHKKYKIHTGPINHIHFSPDRRLMVTGTSHRTEMPAQIYLWASDPKSDQFGISPICGLAGPKLFASSLAVSPDNGEILCGDGAGNLLLWTIKATAERLGLAGTRSALEH